MKFVCLRIKNVYRDVDLHDAGKWIIRNDIPVTHEKTWTFRMPEDWALLALMQWPNLFMTGDDSGDSDGPW